MNLDEIEQNAAHLYMRGDYRTLLDAWDCVPDASKYPEIAYQVAKVYILQDEVEKARQNLDICIAVWGDMPEKLARIYLMYANQSIHEHDFDTARMYIAQVQELSQNDSHQAQCQYLLGEIAIIAEPVAALGYFEQAQKIFMRARMKNPDVGHDVAQASIRAAEVAFQQNMQHVGRRHQARALAITREMGNPRLLAWVLIRTGKTMEMRGQLDQALATYQEAYELLDTRVKFRGRLIHSLAYLKHQMDDDRMALEYLQEPATTDDMDVACELELVRGWIAAYAYDLDYAIAKADGVSAILSNHAVIVNQAAMLRGLACLLRGEVYPLMLNGLRQAVDFYTRQRMLVEESQSRLLLAWALTLTGNSLEAQPLVGRVEAIIEQLGHAALIYRLYQVSLAVLGGYWKRETLIQIESALGHYALSNDRRVRVYALGVPRIFVGNQELKQRDRYGRVGVRILLYMLENRQAYRDEIIEAVYPETDPDTGSARFHKVMSDFKQLLGVPNWYAYSGDNQMYIVREDFPHYYDADDFNRTVETFFRLDTSAQKLSLALRLINLYDVFAKGMEGEVFEELRRLYEGRFMNMLSHAEEGLTNLTTQLPPHWYQQLSRELLRFTS